MGRQPARLDDALGGGHAGQCNFGGASSKCCSSIGYVSGSLGHQNCSRQTLRFELWAQDDIAITLALSYDRHELALAATQKGERPAPEPARS
jgi:hypothetical protein